MSTLSRDPKLTICNFSQTRLFRLGDIRMRKGRGGGLAGPVLMCIDDSVVHCSVGGRGWGWGFVERDHES